MGAGTFKIFNKAKHKIGNGTINLSAGPFRITLHTSACELKTSASGLPLSLHSLIGNEVGSVSGYHLLGEPLSSPIWTVDVTSSEKYKFTGNNHVFTAVGTAIVGIKYMAVHLSAATAAGRHLLCYVTLTGTGFTLAKNNTLTIQMPAGGIFTLK